MFRLIFRALRRLRTALYYSYSNVYTRYLLWCNATRFGKRHRYAGIPYIMVHHSACCTIGKNFHCNSGNANPIGRNTCSYIFVAPGAVLTIGDDVGMSNTAIVCHTSIAIGNRVKMGGGVVIYDTDFHSLDPVLRSNPATDAPNAAKTPVVIEDDVFVGAHCTILKGVRICRGAVIGACSVVTKHIPAGEVWAGNPAKCIKAANPAFLIN